MFLLKGKTKSNAGELDIDMHAWDCCKWFAFGDNHDGGDDAA